MPIRKELPDELLKEYTTPEDLLGEGGLLKQLTAALVERARDAELTHHLGYSRHASEGRNSGNSRNGSSRKTVTGTNGRLELEVPHDRAGTFEPTIVRKRPQALRRLRREDHLDVGARNERAPDPRPSRGDLRPRGLARPDLDGDGRGIDEVRAWQARPLDALYPILYLDALVVKVREGGRVSNRAVYVAIGVRCHGMKEVLGFWMTETEGARSGSRWSPS